HPSAGERHGVRVASQIRSGERRGDAVPIGLRKRALPPRRDVSGVVFLLDVDNTLLDNDAVTDDLRRHLRETSGSDCERRYWEIFEQLRTELGYADYLGALQRYRVERPRDPYSVRISLYLLHYPFADRVYPGAFDAIRRLGQHGRPVILSDGDVVFQPR